MCSSIIAHATRAHVSELSLCFKVSWRKSGISLKATTTQNVFMLFLNQFQVQKLDLPFLNFPGSRFKLIEVACSVCLCVAYIALVMIDCDSSFRFMLKCSHSPGIHRVLCESDGTDPCHSEQIYVIATTLLESLQAIWILEG